MPLAYGTEQPRPAGAARFMLRMTFGFIGYVLVAAGWLWSGIRLRVNPQVVWGVWVLMTGALLGLALYLRVRFRIAGYGYGILGALLLGMLLAVGLVLLLIGLLFKGLSHA